MKRFNYEECMKDVKEGIQEALQEEDVAKFTVMCAFREFLEQYCEEVEEGMCGYESDT